MSASPLSVPQSPRPVSRLLRDECGAAAVEFAIVSGVLLLTIVFVLFVGLLLFLGQALDRATNLAARQIMTGAVQKQGMTQSTFIANIVCPAVPAAINCSNVIANVQIVKQASASSSSAQQPNGYYKFVNGNQTGLVIPNLSNAAAQFNPGSQGDSVYLQIIYPITFLPAFLNNIIGSSATYQGAPAYLSISTAAFVNEQY